MTKVFLIGCGVIGTAVANQWAGHSVKLTLLDRKPEHAFQLAKKIGAEAASHISEAKNADVVFLGVKPQSLPEVAEHLQGVLSEGQMVVSVLAGVDLHHLRQCFEPATPVRLMVNVALQCGESVVGIADDPQLTPTQKETLLHLLQPLGPPHWVPEKLFNPFTVLTGSGPGFLAALLEAVIDASVEMGIPASQAKDLALETFSGTLTLLKTRGCYPITLRREVCSPAGVTSAGIRALESGAYRSVLIEAFQASLRRAEELQPGGA